jgi:nitroimidazol reductase NimA-like FMN-containing flavoprotein (pyridoxamine 5'-phosphate oxidase superfamily)
MGSEETSADELSARECWERLRAEPYGRLAVIGPDGPVIYPINAVVDHATIVFRTTEGTKVEAIRSDPRVAFEVDGWDPTDGVAWSVGLSGMAEEITRMLDAASAVELEVTPWQAGPKPIFIRVTPNSVSGQRFRRTDRRNDME